MGQHKLESEFRKKLNSREMNPTPQAWDRLDAMLTVAEEKKPARNFKWLYIAASFLGFILIATIFFTQARKSGETENAVVIEDNTNPKSSKDAVQKTNALPLGAAPKMVQSQQGAVAETQIEKPAATFQKPTRKQSPSADKIHNAVQIADNSKTVSTVQKISNENQPKNTVNPKVASVDELLAAAGSTVSESPKKQTIKVDANSLLSQVDGELELSFREKVINTVSKNYKTVKVALANRNQE